MLSFLDRILGRDKRNPNLAPALDYSPRPTIVTPSYAPNQLDVDITPIRNQYGSGTPLTRIIIPNAPTEYFEDGSSLDMYNNRIKRVYNNRSPFRDI